MSIIIRVLITALALLIVARIVTGIEVEGVYIAIIAAIILGLLNLIVRPVLHVLTLPITLITLGLFTFVINAGLFLFAASFIQGFSVDGFLTALVGSVVVSLISAVGNKFVA